MNAAAGNKKGSSKDDEDVEEEVEEAEEQDGKDDGEEVDSKNEQVEGGGGGEQADDGITLQKQHTDQNLAHMIDYLQHGDMPDDSKTARHVLLTKDSFAIWNGKLIHLGIKRQKNNSTDQPIAEQLCIPKQLQPTLFARYHEQLVHCGYEKMYLTMKQRVYWGQHVYGRVKLRGCKTCRTAKADNHPVRAFSEFILIIWTFRSKGPHTNIHMP